jgi:exfoliative toxin A/B
MKFEPFAVVIQKIPMPIFAVALALFALGNLTSMYGWPREIFRACGCIALLCIILFFLKLFMYPAMLKKDMQTSPILASVSGGAFMALIQLATYYVKPLHAGIALVLWYLSLVGYIILAIWFTKKYVLEKHDLLQFYPTYFLIYAGIAVAALSSPTFGQQELGRLIFWITLVLFLIFLAIVTVRWVSQPVNPPFRPFFCLFTAPPSLFLASWLVLYPDICPASIYIFMGIAQLLFLMVLAYLPRLFKIPFYASYAALGFPFVITAYALKVVINTLGKMGAAIPTWLATLAYGEFLFALVAVVYVTIWYISFIINYCIICRGPQTL